jgi:hypothetical protein
VRNGVEELKRKLGIDGGDMLRGDWGTHWADMRSKAPGLGVGAGEVSAKVAMRLMARGRILLGTKREGQKRGEKRERKKVEKSGFWHVGKLRETLGGDDWATWQFWGKLGASPEQRGHGRLNSWIRAQHTRHTLSNPEIWVLLLPIQDILLLLQ